MLVLKVILTLTSILTQQCYGHGECDNPSSQDRGCVYTRGPGPENRAECQPVDFSQEDTVSWLVDATGHLDVEFALPHYNCENISCYRLELFVDESVSAEDCFSSTKFKGIDDELRPHSRRRYYTGDTCLNGSHCECKKTGTMGFNFVYSGCYQMVFQPKINMRVNVKTYSHRKYLNTNYSKELIAGPAEIDSRNSRISVTPQYRHVTHSTQVTIAFAQVIYSHLRLEINLMENIDIFHEEACYKTGQHHSCCIIVDNTTRECINAPVPPNRQPVECSVADKSVSCTFSSVKPGNYCFTVHIEEDRCMENTLWTTVNHSLFTCDWQFNFTAPAGSPDLSVAIGESVEKSSLTYIILAVVFIVGVALTVIGIFALRHFGRLHTSSTSSALPSSVIPLEPCRIFLLYARDCKPFMELMATLREVLEDATKCEVIDCLDPSRWNDIGRSPMEWVRGHIEHPNTKVVLAATQIAYLRQQAHLNHTTTYYKEPATYDSLFTYGLKTLTDNLSQDIYRKICVIRFEGFSDDGNLFSHLTPYTRFVLPAHLQKLILSLQPSVSSDPDMQLGESKEVQKLTQDLTNLINYKNTNMNYIQNLLIVQRNNVNLI